MALVGTIPKYIINTTLDNEEDVRFAYVSACPGFVAHEFPWSCGGSDQKSEETTPDRGGWVWLTAQAWPASSFHLSLVTWVPCSSSFLESFCVLFHFLHDFNPLL